jgi:ubiquinone/menaquinone biosynthesis C-methylase UbiE
MMNTQNENLDIAWSLYWSQDRLHSCVASGADTDQQALETLWQDFAKSLDQTRVLDLATGNGAVPFALLAERSELEIYAVDRAEIDPVKFLSQGEALKAVKFYSETDIYNLPFEEKSFSALTSQFGIEYAGLQKASVAVMKLLKVGGKFQFIVHNKDSDIILSSGQKLQELEQLLKPEGLLETLMKVMRGEVEFSELEDVGKKYLEQESIKTQALSGQIFDGINQLSQKLGDDSKGAIDLALAIDLRVRSEYQRLQEMADAAQDADAMDDLVDALRESNVHTDSLKPIYADQEKEEYLLGWLISGAKTESTVGA